MTEHTENLILEYLRVMRGGIDQIKVDVHDLKLRVGSLESGQAILSQQLGHLHEGLAMQQVSLDKMSDRVERVERRLALA
jgi:uncharacterized coiled-coil protein SlyX